MDDGVEGGPLVHEGQRLGVDGFQQGGGVLQRLPGAIRADDGNPMAGTEDFRLERDHFPQGLGPFLDVALHLLWVPGVGDGPDEQVSGAEQPVVRTKHPGMIVRLAFPVPEQEGQAAHAHRQPFGVGLIGEIEIHRHLEGFRPAHELATVDDAGPGVAFPVAQEPRG